MKSKKMIRKGFASDNYAGIHPQILKAITDANLGHVTSYGDDDYTHQAIQVFKQHFGEDSEVNFVFNGTAANVLSIMVAGDSYNSVICTDTAHINVDECGAPEKITGSKLITVPNKNGKLLPESVKTHLDGFDFEHHTQPGIISISQVTELGTIYTPNEIRDLADLAHKHGMYLHMDGARLANAAASLNLPFRAFTRDCGVDILSFGGTKNGMLLGEAVLFFQNEFKQGFKYLRKQNMQLFSKMRFISAQFIAYFEDDLWLKSAKHANNMAKMLAEKIKDIPQIEITHPVDANGIFAIIPQQCIEPLQEKYFFYMWDKNKNEARWMCAFDTSKEDVELFVTEIKKLVTIENTKKE